MIFFLIIIVLLYILSFRSFNERVSPFNKEHVSILKGVMAMSIVAFHLSYQTDDWLFMFSSWGAPVVSIFYFISGYGWRSIIEPEEMNICHISLNIEFWGTLFFPSCWYGLSIES